MKQILASCYFFLLLLALLGCRAGRSAQAEVEVTPIAGVENAVDSGLFGALSGLSPGNVSSEFPNASGPPTIGGLVASEQLSWYKVDPVDPLAYLLRRYLHRSLLDPISGEPSLASAWSLSESEVTFTLQPDARWSDGDPLNAPAVADVLQREAQAGNLPGLKGAFVLDETRLQLELAPPICTSLMQIATVPIVASKTWPPGRTSGKHRVIEEGGSWRLSDDLMSYRRYPDELALRDAWKSGEINSIIGANQLTFGPLPGPQIHPEQSGPLLATLLFRLDDPLLAGPEIREALSLATNRAALYRQAYEAEPPPLLKALLPAGHWAAPDLSLPTDRDRAAALLERSGWQDRNNDGVRENEEGVPLRLELTVPLGSDPKWEMVAQRLADQWAAVGVNLIPIYLESYAIQERLDIGRWQVALLTYNVAPDPDQRALWTPPVPGDLVGQDLNVTGYDNPTVTRLLAEGAKIPGCEIAERRPVYQKVWEHLLDDRPLWPLFPLPLDAVARPGVLWPDHGR